MNTSVLPENLEIWSAYADDLSAHFIENYLNRRDRWGGYYEDSKGWHLITHPAKHLINIEGVGKELLLRHFKATTGSDIIGLHTTQSTTYGVCRWLMLDMDNHLEIDEAKKINWANASKIMQLLNDLKINYLVEDSDGKGGLHLWVRFSEPVKSEIVFYFCKHLLASAGIPESDVETFPKQATLKGEKGDDACGNWARLPGRHYKRDHWSKFYDPATNTFEGGEVGIKMLLGLKPNNPALIPIIPVIEDAKKSPETPIATHQRSNVPSNKPYAERLFWALWFEIYPHGIESTVRALQDGGFTVIRDDGDCVYVESPWQSQYTTLASEKDVSIAQSMACHSFHQTDKSHFWDGVSNPAMYYAEKYLPTFWSKYQTELQAGKERNELKNVEKWGYEAPVEPSPITPNKIEKPVESPPKRKFRIMSFLQVMSEFGDLREEVIGGILRRGEIANLIAAPKTGKSWAVGGLAFATALGESWFGHPCKKGKVLILDNELHGETYKFRLKKIMTQLGVTVEEIDGKIDSVPLRTAGRLPDVNELREIFKELKPREYSIIILDSLYRALPADTQENDNGALTQIYNILDEYAQMVDTSIVIVHHTSKGVQGSKSITDVGAGAGAMTRATDTHIILRPHATSKPENKTLVMEAEVRSFATPSPTCWRFNLPLYEPQPDLDPTDLLKETGKRKKPTVVDEPMTPQIFVHKYITQSPKKLATIKVAAGADGISARDVSLYVSAAEDLQILKTIGKARNTAYFRGDSLL